MRLHITILFILVSTLIYGQVGIGTTSPDSSSILDITSVQAGLLIPRMTEAQRNAIPTPAEGLMIYQTDVATKGFYYYDGTAWSRISFTGIGAFEKTGTVIHNGSDFDSEDFVFGSTQLDNDPGTGDDNNRVFFDKSHGAFRAGRTNGDEWDSSNLGTNSFATGWNNIASGSTSFAGGESNEASGNTSTALGVNNTASGNTATAVGTNNTASGLVSFATGFGNISSNNSAFTAGWENTASANEPFAAGYRNTASAFATAAIGENNESIGYAAFTSGGQNTASGAHSTAMGYRNTVENNWGVVLGIDNTVSGNAAAAIGENNSSIGFAAFTSGGRNTASGAHSTAMGLSNTVESNWGVALGRNNQVNADIGSAIGRDNNIEGYASFAAGVRNTTEGPAAIALGVDVTAQSYAETTIGRFNELYTPISATDPELEDRLFVIGNGTSNTNRSNALTILKNGKTGLGTTTPDTSAILDINSTDAGILIPRMTQAQRDGITTPTEGLMIYQTDALNGFYYYNGTIWTSISASANSGEFEKTGNIIHNGANFNTEDFVFGSSQLDNDTSTTDDNSRTFFDKSMGAFRTGRALNDQWDTVNLGLYSFGAGQNSIASGVYSFAAGSENRSSGDASFTSGSNNSASNTNSAAFGTQNISFGNSSFATGVDNQVEGTGALASGVRVSARSYAQTTVGTYSEIVTISGVTFPVATDPLFVVGNGTSFANRSNALTILKNGNIGIGISNPTIAKVVIDGSLNSTIGNYGFLNSGGSTGTSTPNAQNYSLYASNRIAASEFNAFSDARIKNIEGVSNNTEDLETLTQIEVTNYTLKDTIAKGKRAYKKVIAQQLDQVYPQAVTKDIRRVIPDIYQVAQLSQGWLDITVPNLKVGDTVKLIYAEGNELVEVLEIHNLGIKVTTKREGRVFVYGREVSDFHVVDYEALTTLNISATQALIKKIVTLEKNNETNNKRLSALEDQFLKLGLK